MQIKGGITWHLTEQYRSLPYTCMVVFCKIPKLRYNLGRKLMLNWGSLDAFKKQIDSCAQTPGIYAFGFHGDRNDETWITEDSLMEIIDYITAKGNCEITTYSAVFDAIGTTVLEKRIAALEG